MRHYDNLNKALFLLTIHRVSKLLPKSDFIKKISSKVEPTNAIPTDLLRATLPQRRPSMSISFIDRWVKCCKEIQSLPSLPRVPMQTSGAPASQTLTLWKAPSSLSAWMCRGNFQFCAFLPKWSSDDDNDQHDHVQDEPRLLEDRQQHLRGRRRHRRQLQPAACHQESWKVVKYNTQKIQIH